MSLRRKAVLRWTLRAFRNADRFSTLKIFRRAGALRRRLLFFPSFRGGRGVTLFRMSAQEIIAELAKLKPEELRLVKEKLNRLNAASAIPQTGWGRAFSRWRERPMICRLISPSNTIIISTERRSAK